MNLIKKFVAGLGNQTAPFGFAPEDPNASYKAGLSYIGDIGANLMANNQGGVDPFANLGASIQQAKQSGTQRNKEAYTAQRLMEEAALKRQEREAEAQQRAMMEEQIAQLDPSLQGIARMMPEKFFGAQIEKQFGSPSLTTDQRNFQMAQENPAFAGFLDRNRGGGDGSSNWGMSVVPLKNRKTGVLAAGQFNQGQGGIFINGEPVDPNEWEFDPGALAQDRAEGAMIGGAPKSVIEDYTKTTRPAMTALAETATSLREAKRFLEKGIQTGSMSETLQGLRGLGAQFGFNVDESILSNTQAYQNFIGNTVIPRMAALGGNDSNEELRKLYSLSGGDINQSLSALKDTMAFMERLLKKKYGVLKASEDVALRYIPGLAPVPFDGEGAVSEDVDLSTMSDAELEALANGQ